MIDKLIIYSTHNSIVKTVFDYSKALQLDVVSILYALKKLDLL